MFAIICDARKGHSKGVGILAMVDRSKTRARWWTSDCTGEVKSFASRTAAEQACRSLTKNNPRVVDLPVALARIEAQSIDVVFSDTAVDEGDLSWEAHKG